MSESALGAGVGGGFNFGFGIASAIAAKNAQKRAQKYAVHNFKHRYQWTMEDLRKANLNPILAIGGASGGVGSGASMGPGPTIPGDMGPSSGAGVGRMLELIKKEKRKFDDEHNVSSGVVNLQKKQMEKIDAEMEQIRQNSRSLAVDADFKEWQHGIRTDQRYGRLARAQFLIQGVPSGVAQAVGTQLYTDAYLNHEWDTAKSNAQAIISVLEEYGMGPEGFAALVERAKAASARGQLSADEAWKVAVRYGKSTKMYRDFARTKKDFLARWAKIEDSFKEYVREHGN